ncbi:hypothetical protein AA0242T_1941 [Acetobacter aceti NRIC 0242]|uniref:Peptidase M15C domain-containing protein n=1 Tax=Acetobacter aceti NBRC 14818 TaxID=887700 RepID=A0AB33IFK7_ACEAC|nr:M15 family metallopeptidase [Acetobacter aceti]TCS27511.1 peptidoglycan L-alanyl-D-glutamate endopeptidase CwlK [Acetobacter aceti NBRC 14818]BCK75962.1 hypothetical protein EMQ_1568 [Acetobacter aceti NBRC 14818]GAN58860.1 peptidase M15B/C, DD-carboxypeptidase [Acetobacter aceti NBRC 14818]GBO81239.1 hypothetical protein AA0242T_1941 [Acetobacter aceti NRIC 0242]
MESLEKYDDIIFFQRFCASCGLYGGPIDGVFHENMRAASDSLKEQYEYIRNNEGVFDARSEKNILSLIPEAQIIARRMLVVSRKLHPLVTKIISGTRTYAEQDALYAIGRTIDRDKRKVTNARGGESNHNFGIAWDVGIFDENGRYMNGDQPDDERAYQHLAAVAKAEISEIEWGGDWTSFVDPPHYQLKTGKSAKEIRELFEEGRLFVS